MKLITFSLLLTVVMFVEAIENQEGTESNELGRGLDPGRLLSSMANNFVSRGYGPSGIGGGSQLITFNVQNLLYLVLLKVLIYAAATYGGKHFKDEYGRSGDLQPERFLSEEEILMFLSYLSGSPSCLQNISCQQPQKAKKYVAAGDLLLKAAKMFSVTPDVNYHYVLQGMDQAANIGLSGGNCSTYQCGSKENS